MAILEQFGRRKQRQRGFVNKEKERESRELKLQRETDSLISIIFGATANPFVPTAEGVRANTILCCKWCHIIESF